MNRKMIEGKNLFARILSNENLRVVHDPKATTASMDVVDRVLTLPVWKNMSEDLYTLFIAHEVGHARFTPGGSHGHKKMKKACKDIPFSYLNICEDVRIEKKMKKEFFGLPKIFSDAYKEGKNNHGFFDLSKYPEIKSYDDLPLIDRINIYSKMGHFVDVNFKNQKERDLLRQVEQAVTFDETVEAAKAVYKYALEEAKTDNHTERRRVRKKGKADEVDGIDIDKNRHVESLTEDEMDELMDSLKDQDNTDIEYISVGQLQNLDPYVIDVSEVLKEVENFRASSSEYKKFKRENQKIVNYMVSCFKMYQAARLSEKSKTAKTGVIDPIKMMSYKVSEDIFKRNRVKPKGKKHSLAILLDWSGSMREQCLSSVEQVITLVDFCNKLMIPYEVFSFTTNSFDSNIIGSKEKTEKFIENNNLIEGDYTVCPNLNMIQLASSKINFNDQEKIMEALYVTAKRKENGGASGYQCLPCLRNMCGTPLKESILCASGVIETYKKNYKVDISNMICITDGAGDYVSHTVYKNNSLRSVYGANGSILYDRLTGLEYFVDKDVETSIIELIQNRHGTKVIGFYIANEEDFPDVFAGDHEDKKEYKNNGCVEIKHKSYDKYFIINEFDSLSSNNKTKNINTEVNKRKILSSFIKEIAT